MENLLFAKCILVLKKLSEYFLVLARNLSNAKICEFVSLWRKWRTLEFVL